MQPSTTHPLALNVLKIPDKFIPWLMWFVGLGFATLQFWTQLAMGQMGSAVMRDFSLDAYGLSQLSAAYFYVFVGMQVPAGIMLDRFGATKVLRIAVAFLAIGCLLFSTAKDLPMAYLGRFLMGGGSAFAFVGMLTLAAGWFDAKRFVMIIALSEMLCLAFVSAGEFVLPYFVKHYGWRSVIQLSSILSVGFLILMWTIVYDGPRSIKATKGSLWVGVKKHLLTTTTVLNALASGFLSIIITVFIPLWGLPFLISVHKLTYMHAGWGVAVVVLGIALGSPFFGWLASRIERKQTLLMASIGAELVLISILLLAYPLPMPILYPLLFLLGLGNSVYILCFSIAKEATPEGFQGMAMAFTNMMTMSGSIFIQPIIGYLLVVQEYDYMLDGVPIYGVQDYRMAFLVFPICFSLSLLCARLLHKRS